MADAIIRLGLDDSNFTSGIQSAQAEIDKFNRKEGVTNSKIFNLNRNLNEAKRNFLSAAYNYKKLGDEGRKTDAGRKLLDIKEKAAATIRELQATKNELQELTRISNQTSMGGGKNGLMGSLSSLKGFGGGSGLNGLFGNLKGVSSSFDGMSKAIEGVSSSLGGMAKAIGTATVVGAVVGAVVGEVASEMFKVAAATSEARSRIEQLEVSFSTLLGSQVRANALLAELKSYGTVTPYNTEGLAQAARLMLSYGISTNKVMPTLRMLGDIAMGDNEKLQSLTLAFAQMSASGRVCKQDLNQMVNAGFNPLQIIAEQTGKSIGELNDEVSAGKISVNQIEQAFKSATSEGGKFHGMVNNMSDTITGRFAEMNDSWEEFKASFGEWIEPATLGFIKTTTKLIEGMTDALNNLRRSMGDTSILIRDSDNATSNALKYAENKGNKGGKTKADKQKIRNKAINNAINFEGNIQRNLDKHIEAKKKEIISNYLKYQHSGAKVSEGIKERLYNNNSEYKALVNKKNLTVRRISEYKKALTENPYNTTSTNNIPTIPSGGGGGGRHTNKGGGAKNTNKEVIPQGSLAELENQLSIARKAASNAVGEEAYFQATQTAQAIEDKIENFKFNSYKNADNSPIKNPIKTPTLKLSKYGVVGNILPSEKEMKKLGDTLIERLEQIREESYKTQEAFKDLTENMRSKYGGNVVAFTNDFAELAKFIEEGGNTTTAAASGLVILGDALQQIGGNGVIAKTGAVMAAIGQCILGFAQASAQAASLGPWGWLAFVGAGLGTLATMISTIQGYSNGGIIGGATTSGDMQLARVNAGEMILNNSQQARLFDLLDGGASMVGYGSRKVEFKISGQNLVGTLRNYNNKMSKVR